VVAAADLVTATKVAAVAVPAVYAPTLVQQQPSGLPGSQALTLPLGPAVTAARQQRQVAATGPTVSLGLSLQPAVAVAVRVTQTQALAALAVGEVAAVAIAPVVARHRPAKETLAVPDVGYTTAPVTVTVVAVVAPVVPAVTVLPVPVRPPAVAAPG
jgi:hypothetical protein